MNEPNWREIGQRLRTLRKDNCLTIERLADILGVTTSFIGQIEKGDTGTSISKLYKLAQLYNRSLDFIITGKDATLPNETNVRLSKLNIALYDYSDNHVDFVVSLADFLKDKMELKS
jgi:transcriptional regulator with XRE-family HTH domain